MAPSREPGGRPLTEGSTGPEARRGGDSIEIDGAYQHRARHAGFVVQRFWHAEKERMLGQYCPAFPGERVLDVGCGSGVISGFLARSGARTSGIDANPTAIDFARRTYVAENLDFQLGHVEDLDFPPGSVDRVYCLEVVEHLFEAQAVDLFARLRVLVRPGGTLCVTTPNYRGLWPALEIVLDRLKLAAPMAEHQHVSRFTRRKLLRSLSGAGWDVKVLRTFSTLAPFASVFGWKIGLAAARLEDRIDLPFGNILLAVAERP
jgi:2-polyprenyl-6-hydroxyphenyl methylase/3-demethylubiquinone-9 3-methyltransferase